MLTENVLHFFNNLADFETEINSKGFSKNSSLRQFRKGYIFKDYDIGNNWKKFKKSPITRTQWNSE